MMVIEKSGLLTSIQDLGRYGFKKYGVITSGAMDPLSHRIANLLVGNDENEPTVEITLYGPTIRFLEDTLISVCGGNLSPSLNDRPMDMSCPIRVQKGDVLTFGQPKNGCRAYLAVHGGININKVMGSYSTYLRAQFGGYKGRALQKGDRLEYRPYNSEWEVIGSNWFASSTIHKEPEGIQKVRVVEGRQFEEFTKESKDAFVKETYTVSSQSDRMGYRMEGVSLQLSKQKEIISEAVTFGTIQVPANGKPIILMADSQTIGGYPKIADVISVDLPVVAQAKPGDSLQFEWVTLDKAQRLYLNQENQLKLLKRGIGQKFNKGEENV